MEQQQHFYLDGKSIKTEMDFYVKLNEFFDFEKYVEGSARVPVPDVLWDVMSCGAGLNCILHWKNSETSREILGDTEFNTIIRVLNRAETVTWSEGYTPFKFYLE